MNSASTAVNNIIALTPPGVLAPGNVQWRVGVPFSTGRLTLLYNNGSSDVRVMSLYETQQVDFVDGGTAAEPTLVLGTDLNTGLFHPSADVLAVSAAGVEVQRWSSSLVTLADAVNVAVGTTTGTRIGTATTQKLGFYGATPIVQGAGIADAAGGTTIDAEARAAVNAVISRLEALGLIATV
jgi:hypothetical protein